VEQLVTLYCVSIAQLLLPVIEAGLARQAGAQGAGNGMQPTRQVVLASVYHHMEHHVAPILFTAGRQAAAQQLQSAQATAPGTWGLAADTASRVTTADLHDMLQQCRDALEQPASSPQAPASIVFASPCSVLAALCTDSTTGYVVLAAAAVSGTESNLQPSATSTAPSTSSARDEPSPSPAQGGALQPPTAAAMPVANAQAAAVLDFVFDCSTTADFHSAFRQLCNAHCDALVRGLGAFILGHKQATGLPAGEGAHGPTAALGTPYLVVQGAKAAAAVWGGAETAQRSFGASSGSQGQQIAGAVQWLLAQATAAHAAQG